MNHIARARRLFGAPTYRDEPISQRLEAIGADIAGRLRAGVYNELAEPDRTDLRGLSITLSIMAEPVHALETECAAQRRELAHLQRRRAWWPGMAWLGRGPGVRL